MKRREIPPGKRSHEGQPTVRPGMKRGAASPTGDVRARSGVDAPRRLEPPTSQVREYLTVLRLRKWWILLLTAIACGSAYLYSSRQTPTYQSTAEVQVRSVDLSSSGVPSVGFNIQMDTERQVAGSAAVAKRAAAKLPGSPQRIGRLSVDLVGTSDVLVFTSSSSDPQLSQHTAQAFAEAYLESRRDQLASDLTAISAPLAQRLKALDQQLTDVSAKLFAATDESARTGLQIQYSSLVAERSVVQQKLDNLLVPGTLSLGQIIKPADLPDSQVSPNLPRTMEFALFVGLSLGVGMAFLRDRLDERIRGREDLEARVGVPVLAVIPPHPRRRRSPGPLPIIMLQPESRVAEAYRGLRTSVLFAASQRGLRTLMITSPTPAEGKTVTVANLGVALAQTGKRVVLVAADLRKSRLREFFETSTFRLDPHVGLSRVLEGQDAAQALASVGVDNLSVLDTGPVPPNPAELLGSDEMRNLLIHLSEIADFVLIDSAPLLSVTDSIALAPLTDGVIFVADAERTTASNIEDAMYRLGQVDARVIGAVLHNHDGGRARTPSYG